MITEKDFYDIIGKKVSNEIMKNMIKANMPCLIGKYWKICRLTQI